MAKYLTRTIWALSLVSLCTDLASEMLYPVMPVFLKKIGFSVLLIGVLEGVAEAVAGLSKGYFGKWSDRAGRRLPFVQVGYALSAVSKPMMAAFVWPLWIFFARTLDRIGKGVRTGARDALLSDESTSATKGRVFGFHRAMDTLGAVLGPACALVYLHTYPDDYKTLFLLAFLPGLLAIGATFFVREKAGFHRRDAETRRKNAEGETTSRLRVSAVHLSPVNFFGFARYWNQSRPEYRRLVGGLLVFALFNSSDVFLLLRAKESGLSDPQVIGVYIFYNLVYAAAAFPLGVLADKLGMRRVFVGGLLVFSVVYAGMAFAATPLAIAALFFLYGIYAAATEGVAKAWITNVCEHQDTATAIGTYTAFQSLCALLASSLTGAVWYWAGPVAAFGASAVAAVGVGGYLVASSRRGQS
ncbi:MAG: MFS transporter [Saprospiraceae bacterium]